MLEVLQVYNNNKWDDKTKYKGREHVHVKFRIVAGFILWKNEEEILL